MSQTTIDPIAASAVGVSQTLPTSPVATRVPSASFESLLTSKVEQVNQQLLQADAVAASFAIDDSIPLHQVTFALEQARLSFELMMQVRGRLMEGYQELMRMQL